MQYDILSMVRLVLNTIEARIIALVVCAVVRSINSAMSAGCYANGRMRAVVMRTPGHSLAVSQSAWKGKWLGKWRKLEFPERPRLVSSRPLQLTDRGQKRVNKETPAVFTTNEPDTCNSIACLPRYLPRHLGRR
jgi:hypothetical protein